MAGTDLTKDELTRLLREAQAAHGVYEKEELGGVRDEEISAAMKRGFQTREAEMALAGMLGEFDESGVAT